MLYRLEMNENQVDVPVISGEYALLFQVKLGHGSAAVYSADGECHHDLLEGTWKDKHGKRLKKVPVALFAKKAPSPEDIAQLTDTGAAVIVYGTDGNIYHLNKLGREALKGLFKKRLRIA